MATTAYETILLVRLDGVGLVTLNRPERRNAYTARMGIELHEAFAELEADEAVRAIVVTGAGRDFCVGADLERGGDTFKSSPGDGRETMRGGRRAGPGQPGGRAGSGAAGGDGAGQGHRRQRRPRVGRDHEAPDLPLPGRDRSGRRPRPGGRDLLVDRPAGGCGRGHNSIPRKAGAELEAFETRQAALMGAVEVIHSALLAAPSAACR